MGTWIFGPFCLDPGAYRLTRRVGEEPEQPVTLRPKAFELLCYLVKHAGRVIPQEEFLSALWPETYVQPEVLKGHVLAVRTALGDRISAARYIETVRGRGYRFVAEVRSAWTQGAPDCEANGAEWLVGRAAARDELQRALARARSNEAQIVFLTGETGIGKTAVADAFAQAAATAGATVVTAHCFSGSGQTDAYYPVLEILGALSRGSLRGRVKTLLMQYAPTWLVQLPALMRSSSSDVRGSVFDATPHRMARELCDLLDALARSACVLLFIEDLHWADRATLDLIHALASRRLRSQLMIVATLRTSVSTEADCAAGALVQKLSLYRLACEISLQPLEFRDVEAFLSQFAKTAPPKKLAQHLHARSEGNPLYLRAMLDLLVQRNLLSWDQDGWRLDAAFEPRGLRAPPSLVQVIEAEIGDLPLQAQSVLEAASVSEGPFSPLIHHVASMVDEQTFEALCEALSRRGQLIRRSEVLEIPDGRKVQTYTFRHALFQEVAYERQGAARRARGHAAVAARLGQVFAADPTAIAPSLARHFLQAGQWPEAIRSLRMTARTAIQRFALREAAALLEQAITLSRSLPGGAGAEAELGSLEELARVYGGALDARAEPTYERLARLARDLGRVDVEARALLGLGYVVSWTDRDRCLEILRQSLLKSTEVADATQRARVRSGAHGWRSWVQGWSGADAEGQQAAFDELRRSGDPLALGASLMDHSLILFPSARYTEAIDVVARGFKLLVTHGVDAQVDLSLPLWMTRLGPPWALMSAGRFGEALDGFSSGYAAFEANGQVGRGATLRLYHAFVYQRMHDHPAALQILDETLARMRDNGAELSPNETKIELVVRGLAELGLGSLDLAFEHLMAARAEMQRRNTLTSWYWRLAVEWGLTDFYLVTGDLAAAEPCAREFLERACAIEERGWRALAAESCARVALARADVEVAGFELARAWAAIDGYDTPLVRWRLHAVAAMCSDALGEGEAAARHRHLQAGELERLAATLPSNHAGRDKLRSAQPMMPAPDRPQSPSPGTDLTPPVRERPPTGGYDTSLS